MSNLFSLAEQHPATLGAIATLAIAVISFLSLLWSIILVRESWITRKINTSPHVVCFLRMHKERGFMIDLVVKNNGFGLAREIKISLDHGIDDLRQKNIKFFEYDDRPPISALPSQEGFTTFFIGGYTLMQEPHMRPFGIKVHYKNSDKSKDFLEFYDIDPRQFQGILTANNDPIDKIAKGVDNLSKVMSSVCNGTRFIHIHALDIDGMDHKSSKNDRQDREQWDGQKSDADFI